MKPPDDQAPLILIADDEPMIRLQLRRAMEQEGYRVAEAKNGEECLAAYLQFHPDIVLLDAIMPSMDGFTCCHQLQQLSTAQPVPVLMITGLEDKQSVDRAFAVGAVDYVTKPIHWAVLLQRVRRLIHQSHLYEQLALANQELQCLANLDGLTGVANRRRFDEYLNKEWRRLTREQRPLSLILCDIDFFKSYNDAYGHQAGDLCLQQVARTIAQTVKRPSDLVCRYGGEEFVVILPCTDAAGASHIAQEIQSQLRSLQLLHNQSSVDAFVTLSLGIATTIPDFQLSPKDLIRTADQALYAAKAGGRNRIEMLPVIVKD
ncbi:regulator [Neosynechococcus sphagnicola sy1]|uniref:Regulator n=1 Tax=Neosynechococcus sphagnicola sy1 TaxID=1497020 RepID=A0A098TP91_9CYAN|nr:PleD family two-component system response regulator [Neosynechococcus sphagnicola]KGF72648.1 regulator [Neosynechococcus sphagnicola sy1]